MERGKAGARETNSERVQLKEIEAGKLNLGHCKQDGAGKRSVSCGGGGVNEIRCVLLQWGQGQEKSRMSCTEFLPCGLRAVTDRMTASF